MAKAGNPLSLTKAKLKHVFRIAINSAPTPKYIAYGLGVQRPETIKEWIKAGEVLQEQFKDELEELDNIFPYMYEEVFENKREQYECEFRMLYDLEPESKIPDRLINTYSLYILKEKQFFVEDNIERKEKEILEDIILDKDETTNENFKLLIQFARIFHRAKNVVEMGLLESINKYSVTSRNIGIGLKMLQLYNKDDFSETSTINHTGTVEVNNKSILSMSLDWERSQRQALEAKNNNIIDVENIKQIEQKEG